MFDYIKSDLNHYRRYHQTKHFNTMHILINCYGFLVTAVYRFGKWAEKQNIIVRLPLISTYYLLEAIVRLLYDIKIKRTAIISPGFYIGHIAGIHLENCIIGSNCSIQQRVIIHSRIENTPVVIGDNVWIGAHSKIEEPVEVADGATVAAGSVVTNDVCASCLVIGSPARIIKQNYDNSDFL